MLFNLPPGDWNAGDRGCASIPGREAEFLAGVERALEYADRPWHADGSMPWRDACPPAPIGDGTARSTSPTSERRRGGWRRQGRTLLIEPINPRDIPGFFLNTQAEAHAIREEVAEASLKVQMDFYHAQIVERRSGDDLQEIPATASATCRSPVCPREASRIAARSTTGISSV